MMIVTDSMIVSSIRILLLLLCLTHNYSFLIFVIIIIVILCIVQSIEILLEYTTVESLECGHLGDLVKCPLWRGVLISGINFTYYYVLFGTSVIQIEVSYFRGVLKEALHCKHCSLVPSLYLHDCTTLYPFSFTYIFIEVTTPCMHEIKICQN